MKLLKQDLEAIASHVGKDWRHADNYYDSAEAQMDQRWETLIRPFIGDVDYRVCLDLAAGHGRNTHKLLQQPGCNKVYVVDLNVENVSYCERRFADEKRVAVIRNDGYSLPEIGEHEITFFYCFDAMVHFDSDIVRSYLREIRRVLAPQGKAFLHHSNLGAYPGRDVHDNPAWRNFMTAELMVHYAVKEGLSVDRQEKLDWNHDRSFIDCFTLLRQN